MIVGCYAMDLYCRKQGNGCPVPDHLSPAQFTGHTEGECKRKARKSGWHFEADGEVTCPQCRKRRNRA